MSSVESSELLVRRRLDDAGRTDLVVLSLPTIPLTASNDTSIHHLNNR